MTVWKRVAKMQAGGGRVAFDSLIALKCVARGWSRGVSDMQTNQRITIGAADLREQEGVGGVGEIFGPRLRSIWFSERLLRVGILG